MKTLVNKADPRIRITAPEVEVHEEEQMYILPNGHYCIPLCIPDWTLVEEEPVDLDEVKAFKAGAEWMRKQMKGGSK